MTTVYLHVGMPKCASSALQSFLHKNDRLHRSEGLCYPVTSRESSGYFSHRPLHKTSPAEIPTVIKMIANEAEKEACEKILISSEEFTNSLWDREITGEIVDALNNQFGASNVRILMLFRNHFPFVESVYAQFLKGGMFRTPAETFIKSDNSGISGFTSSFRDKNGFDFFSYRDFVEKLRVHAPENSFILLSTEREDWDGLDVIDVICRKLGISQGVLNLSSNERYSEEALYLLHYSRRKYGFRRTRERRSIIAALFPPSSRKFSSLLHINGRIYEQLLEASERDRAYFLRNTSDPCQNLFTIPDAYKAQRNQEDQLEISEWHLHLVDRIMEPSNISLRQAKEIKKSLEGHIEK